MTSDQIAFLERWENQEAAGWSIDDLDGDEVRSTVAEVVRRERLNEPERRGVEDLLLELGLMQGDVVYRATAVLYDDRLEITSPGPLHFGLTPEELFEPHRSRQWNPWIAGHSIAEASSTPGARGRSGWPKRRSLPGCPVPRSRSRATP